MDSSRIELFLNIDNLRDLIFIMVKRNRGSKYSRYFAHSLDVAIWFVFLDPKTKRKEGRNVRRRVRRKDWERIQDRILPSPRTVRRELYRRTSRRRRLRPNCLYIHICAARYIYKLYNTMPAYTHANIFAQIYRIARCNRFFGKI